jgi:hypothetical protein
MMIEGLVMLALSASQAERCAPNDAEGAMMCVDRNGHCVTIAIDGHQTHRLGDEAEGARVHAIAHGEDVCWRVDAPVSATFRVRGGNGGIWPNYVGAIEKLQVNLYALDMFDPAVDSRLDQVDGIRTVADGDLDGTWQVKPERPLPPGEYVAVVRVFGVDNWDKQAVLVRIDDKLAPAPAGD